jgi:GntR family carbon starvation induced transcriptional regulator
MTYVQENTRMKSAVTGAAVESLADRTEHALQAAILSGELPPESRLTLPALQAQFGIGATPLREGLSRLTALGLVSVSSNRGFSVASVSYDDLYDITKSRILIEQAALRATFQQQEDAWQDRLVLATSRLLRILKKHREPLLEGDAEYDAAHKEFHTALIAGCGLPRVLLIQSNLYDAAYRYRRVMSHNRLSPEFLAGFHNSLADRVLARDERSFADLEQHLMTTLRTVYGDR